MDVDLISGHEVAECAGFDHGEETAFWEEERDSSEMAAPSTSRDWSSNSASERRQPESRSYSSKAGQMRADRAAVADRLAM